MLYHARFKLYPFKREHMCVYLCKCRRIHKDRARRVLIFYCISNGTLTMIDYGSMLFVKHSCFIKDIEPCFHLILL